MQFIDWLVDNKHISRKLGLRIQTDCIVKNRKIGKELSYYMSHRNVCRLLQRWINEKGD